MKYHIGSTNIFEHLPKLIEIQKKPYILTQDLEKNFVIYSAICPHQQNIVSDLKKDVWHCPSHDWTFDPASGNCLNIPNESLDKINIEIENEQVYIHLDKIEKEIISKSNNEKMPQAQKKAALAGGLMRTHQLIICDGEQRMLPVPTQPTRWCPARESP